MIQQKAQVIPKKPYQFRVPIERDKRKLKKEIYVENKISNLLKELDYGKENLRETCCTGGEIRS